LFEMDPILKTRFGDAERFIRMWEYYLAGFEASFRYYGLAVFQIQLTKNINAVPLTRRYMYKDMDERSSVVTDLFATAEIGVTHERISTPSANTEHDPHCAIPQPKRGPYRSRSFETK
jgi:hypothetical protein